MDLPPLRYRPFSITSISLATYIVSIIPCIVLLGISLRLQFFRGPSIIFNGEVPGYVVLALRNIAGTQITGFSHVLPFYDMVSKKFKPGRQYAGKTLFFSLFPFHYPFSFSTGMKRDDKLALVAMVAGLLIDPLSSNLFRRTFIQASNDVDGYFLVWQTNTGICVGTIACLVLFGAIPVAIEKYLHNKSTGLASQPGSIANLLGMVRGAENIWVDFHGMDIEDNRRKFKNPFSKMQYHIYADSTLGKYVLDKYVEVQSEKNRRPHTNTSPPTLDNVPPLLRKPQRAAGGTRPLVGGSPRSHVPRPQPANNPQALRYGTAAAGLVCANTRPARFDYIPVFLRAPLLAILASVLFCGLVFSIVLTFSGRGQAGGFSPLAPTTPLPYLGISVADFLWSFFPAFVAGCYSEHFQNIDIFYRSVQPYADLRYGNAPFEVLELNYCAEFFPIATVKALRRRHFRVALSSTIHFISSLLPVHADTMFYIGFPDDTGAQKVLINPRRLDLAIAAMALLFLSLILLIPTQVYYMPHPLRNFADHLSFLNHSSLRHEEIFTFKPSSTTFIESLGRAIWPLCSSDSSRGIMISGTDKYATFTFGVRKACIPGRSCRGPHGICIDISEKVNGYYE